MTGARKDFANLIRTHRHKSGMTQLLLSYNLGFSSNCVISRMETGDCLPSMKIVLKIAQVLQIPQQALFDAFLAIEAESLRKKMEACDRAKS